MPPEPPVIVIHDALLAADHVHPAVVDKAKEPLPAAETTFALVGFVLNEQPGASCVTLKFAKVKNCPLLKLTEIAPFRCAPEFAAIVKLTVPELELVTFSQATPAVAENPPQPTD